MYTDIPLFSEAREFLRMVPEQEAQLLVKAHHATVVMARNGQPRRLYEIADVDRPLTPEERARARAGYLGQTKYTYLEELQTGRICSLKKYRPQYGDFVRWPKSA